MLFDLHRIPIQLWDESRLANNALEMYDSGELLVTTFEGKPDLWNTKPPLLIWLQVGMMHLLGGPSELAIRIPSAAAAVASVLLLIGFSARGLGSWGTGLAAGFILVTIPGYVSTHMARTGDYDSMLIWWLILGLVSFFQFLETNRPQYLLLWGLSITAAIMTKGVAALLGSPALLLYAILQGRLWQLLRQPRVWAVLLGALVMPALYYLTREAAAPGYWHAVVINELGGRFAGTLDEHQGPWTYYLNNMQHHLLGPWKYCLLPASIILALERPSAARRLSVLLFFFIVCWLTIISTAQTKLEWYPGPVYPLLAWLMGMALNAVYHRAQQWLPTATRRWQPLFGLAALLLLILVPYQNIIQSIIDQRSGKESWSEDTSTPSFLRHYLREHPDFRTIALVYPGGYRPLHSFYTRAYAHQGILLSLTLPNDLQKFKPGEEVIVYNQATKNELLATYQTVLLYEQDGTAAYSIQGKR
ncbi:ArnT family glycosyltransferase [Hymenobacter algoricola]|uniref:ArnT family glycosyltransferase n=1 Tax=Hymenobacter algoricola TaxID=486267 RepID=UPI0031EDB84E